jgi:hypothetical protein
MRRYVTAIAVLLAVFLLAAASGDAAQRDRDRDRGRDDGWELLGRQRVDLSNERDRIEVGKSEGQFRQLQIRVDDAPIEINKMVVTFGNGETFEPRINERLGEDVRTRAIDLPGERRVIKRIDFNYRTANRREGRATVSVYGR